MAAQGKSREGAFRIFQVFLSFLSGGKAQSGRAAWWYNRKEQRIAQLPIHDS